MSLTFKLKTAAAKTWRLAGQLDQTSAYHWINETADKLATFEGGWITADQGHLVIRTDPLSTPAAIETVFETVQEILDLCQTPQPASLLLDPDLPQGSLYQAFQARGITWHPTRSYKRYLLQNTQVKPTFQTDATLDIPFETFTRFLQLSGQKPLFNLIRSNTPLAVGSQNPSPDLFGSTWSETAQSILNHAHHILASSPCDDPGVLGFLTMILMALSAGSHFNPHNNKTQADPTTAFAVQPHHRYSEMWQVFATNPVLQKAARQALDDLEKNILDQRQQDDRPYLFQHPYWTQTGWTRGPTVKEWFDSLKEPPFMDGPYADHLPQARRADLLSPPPGHRHQQQGLGAYDLHASTHDQRVPCFELRDFMNGQPMTCQDIKAAALQLHTFEQQLLKPV